MKVDLLPMPYTYARELINYCAERDIDRDNVMRLLEAFTTVGSSLSDEHWCIEVPDHIMTYFILKWS
jgi:hypothetical protein